ncbi:MAG: hypothetical protein JOY62_14330 [Acidobacteriaceae bacterium]|nr:hypothetical protein [Acidobacteriaceae bacterium]MBV9781138.1 hypothetical protein [Acidobacteriaceae bacterium]
MRRVLLLCIAMSGLAIAATPDESAAIATVQRLFDAMEAHNAEAARTVFISGGATLTAVRANGDVSNSTSEQFVGHVASAKEAWLERMWDPKVMIRENLAIVWAEYDFHLNSQFHHCGVDSVTLVKAAGEWKISGIAYTMETSGCAPSPLGPPKK